jgi:hypothetical protein
MGERVLGKNEVPSSILGQGTILLLPLNPRTFCAMVKAHKVCPSLSIAVYDNEDIALFADVRSYGMQPYKNLATIGKVL